MAVRTFELTESDDFLVVFPDGVGNADSVFVDARGGNDAVYLNYLNDVFTGVNGGSGRDIIVAGQGGSSLDGGGGNDDMTGGLGEDYAFGFGGNDTFKGGKGNDYGTGGAGNDKFDGGAGNDILFGDGGNDTLIGGAGDDTLDGGRGADRFFGGGGRDVVRLSDGDTIFGGVEFADEETFFFDSGLGAQAVIGRSVSSTPGASINTVTLFGSDGDTGSYTVHGDIPDSVFADLGMSQFAPTDLYI